MADHPDFYADGVAVSVGPFGITVSFQLSRRKATIGFTLDARHAGM